MTRQEFGAIRVDVKENLERAAAAELRFHGNYIALVSRGLVDEVAQQASGWSLPVQLQFEPDDNGIVEITVREVPS